MLSPLIRMRAERARIQGNIERLAKMAAAAPPASEQRNRQLRTIEQLRDALTALDKRIERLEGNRRAP